MQVVAASDQIGLRCGLELAAVKARALGYVAARKCSAGGFCFYRTRFLEEPNLADTFYALSTYRLLGREIPDKESHAAYLADCRPSSAQTDPLYYFVFSALSLGKPQLASRVLSPGSRLEMTDRTPQISVTAWLARTLKILRLEKAWGQPVSTVADRVRKARRGPGWGDKPNLWDTYLALRILEELDGLRAEQDAADFIDRLQAPLSGFRATEDSSLADIDTVYAGVLSCALLGLPLRYPRDVLRFVLMCQRSHGGFGRTLNGIGDLRTTFMALRIVEQLCPGSGNELQ